MGPLFGILASVLQLYSFVLLARILLSWVPNLDPYHPAVQFLRQITDPVLEPARKLIPPIGMIDISPLVVLIAISMIERVLWSLA